MKPFAKINGRELLSFTSYAGGPYDTTGFEIGISTVRKNGDKDNMKSLLGGRLEIGSQLSVIIDEESGNAQEVTGFGIRITKKPYPLDEENEDKGPSFL